MSYENCKVCGKFTKTIKCEYRGHNNKCAECGNCPDCNKYEAEVRRYHEMINDPEYCHEPWDWSDTPDSRVPKKPLKRMTSFPGDNKILEVIGPIQSRDFDSISLIEITFQIKTYTPVACAVGLVGMDKIKETFYYSPEWDQVTVISEFWHWVQSNYTEQVVKEFMEKLKNKFKGKEVEKWT